VKISAMYISTTAILDGSQREKGLFLPRS